MQGQRQNTLNVYYNQNAGNPNAFTYLPDLSKPAFSDRTWENYTPRITWQATQRDKISFSWDEQPVCRKLHGHDLADRHAKLHLPDLARSGWPW